jgi:flavin reductase (DIM6/NTAB) family NADH-FMN oxidoreductase RutF
MIEPSEYRRILGHYATGIAVVTSLRPDGQPCGLTVNSFCSVSLDPALVLVCVDRDAESHDCLRQAGVYAVNVLGERRGEALARRFATWGSADKFQGVAHRVEATGAPVLEDSLAWVDCRIHEAVAGGDHTIFLGEVVAGDAREGTPMVYYRGGYGRFTP